jgi:hypothetical protein
MVLGSHEFRIRLSVVAHRGSPFSTGREHMPGGSAVLTKLREGSEIELSDFEAASVMLKDDYVWPIVEIVIGGIPTILEVRSM